MPPIVRNAEKRNDNRELGQDARYHVEYLPEPPTLDWCEKKMHWLLRSGMVFTRSARRKSSGRLVK